MRCTFLLSAAFALLLPAPLLVQNPQAQNAQARNPQAQKPQALPLTGGYPITHDPSSGPKATSSCFMPTTPSPASRHCRFRL
jgi:hypothetical protein